MQHGRQVSEQGAHGENAARFIGSGYANNNLRAEFLRESGRGENAAEFFEGAFDSPGHENSSSLQTWERVLSRRGFRRGDTGGGEERGLKRDAFATERVMTRGLIIGELFDLHRRRGK